MGKLYMWPDTNNRLFRYVKQYVNLMKYPSGNKAAHKFLLATVPKQLRYQVREVVAHILKKGKPNL